MRYLIFRYDKRKPLGGMYDLFARTSYCEYALEIVESLKERQTEEEKKDQVIEVFDNDHQIFLYQ